MPWDNVHIFIQKYNTWASRSLTYKSQNFNKTSWLFYFYRWPFFSHMHQFFHQEFVYFETVHLEKVIWAFKFSESWQFHQIATCQVQYSTIFLFWCLIQHFYHFCAIHISESPCNSNIDKFKLYNQLQSSEQGKKTVKRMKTNFLLGISVPSVRDHFWWRIF